MPIGKINVRQPAVSAFLAACSLLLNSCIWESKAAYYSPDGTGSLTLLSRYPMNLETLRVRIRRGDQTLFDLQFPGECYLDFIDITWSQDSQRVALFGKGTARIEFAYDLKDRKIVSFSEMRSAVAEHIRKHYSITPGIDPLECGFCVEEFRRRFPSRVIN